MTENSKITRRKLAASLAASAAAAMAQNQKPAAGEELRLARERIQSASLALAKHEVLMSAAPAFQFKP
jgi:hypothetical protein